MLSLLNNKYSWKGISSGKEEILIKYHYCPINFYYSNIIGISHFLRNDNQLFIFGVGVRKRRSRFLTPTPNKNTLNEMSFRAKR